MAIFSNQIAEGALTFRFDCPTADCATKYDDWSYYRNQFNAAFGGTKAVDILFQQGHDAWLIEVKDYRQHRRGKLVDLGEEVAIKVRDSLAGLVGATAQANDSDEKNFAKTFLCKRRFHVVLHLEQPAKHSRLFPQVVDPAKVHLKLKQWLKALDAHPKVVDKTTIRSSGLNWSVH